MVAGALAVPREVPLVVTEGNYLLCGQGFSEVRALLDQCWYVELDPDERRRRLVARHVAHGRTRDEARDWVACTDEPNAVLVDSARGRADLVVRVS